MLAPALTLSRFWVHLLVLLAGKGNGGEGRGALVGAGFHEALCASLWGAAGWFWRCPCLGSGTWAVS